MLPVFGHIINDERMGYLFLKSGNQENVLYILTFYSVKDDSYFEGFSTTLL